MPRMLLPRRQFHTAMLGGAFAQPAAMLAGRPLLSGALAASAALGGAADARAEFRVEISGLGGTQLPLALVTLRQEAASGVALSAIVRADLERSGMFRLLDTQGVALDESAQPDWADWRGRGADALVAGSVSRLADGRYDLRYKLWDPIKGEALLGQSLLVQAADLRLAAHRMADAIQQRLSGERGVNATRIAYVTKAANRYALRITDADGEGGQLALASPQPIISPAWSPNGRRLAYVSFERGKAEVVVQDVLGGQRRVVASYKGSNSAPAWSPDGRSLVVTLTRDGLSQLYLLDLASDSVRRLTHSSGIDTEAVFAPDGRSLYFVSDRGGGPQIYRMAVDGGSAERVTFNGGYNISPALSPDGSLMAYVSRSNGFRLMVASSDGRGSPQAISDTQDDESPSFAPNGRLIIFATRSQGRDVLMTVTPDGRARSRLLSANIDLREPAWGPFTTPAAG